MGLRRHGEPGRTRTCDLSFRKREVLIPTDILSKGVLSLVAETGLEPASTDYEPVPGGFTTPVYSASNSSNWLRRKDSNLRMTRSRDEHRSTWLLRNLQARSSMLGNAAR